MELTVLAEFIMKAGKAVEALAAFRDKLLGNPSKAYNQLVLVLEEISKTFRSLETAVTDLLGIGLTSATLVDDRKKLVELQFNTLKAKIEDSRGHCHMIWNIYCKTLEGWFGGFLDDDEQQEMRETFLTLGNMDGHLYGAMEEMVPTISKEADALLVLLDGNEQGLQEARTQNSNNRRDLFPIWEAMTGAMTVLYKLKGEFIQAARIVPGN